MNPRFKKTTAFRILMPLGVVLAAFPLLFKDYITMPDFLRGAIEGIGIGLEITALVIQKRFQKGCAKGVSIP